MVRATRSTAALQNQQIAVADQPPPSPKKLGKKRKRSSVLPNDGDDQRTTKQRRAETKQEDEAPGVGDMPLNKEDATKILDILEMIDTQGLLDRVFPLPDTEPISNGTASSSKELSKMYSLRTLLKEESPHPLRVIRDAIRPLFPISSHPRTRASLAVSQQLHFCNLALSLLDQSSQEHPPISLSQTTLLPELEDAEHSLAGLSDKRRRYALVQRLPGGDWWSSSNTEREGEQGLTAAEAKELVKGQAELVSILPSLPLPLSSLPTLGDLQPDVRRESRYKFKPLYMHPRHVSSGTFLDYGPFSSFAPSFDSEGGEVGREGLGQVYMGRIEKRKIKEMRRRLLERIQREQTEEAVEPMETDTVKPDLSAMEELLSSLFPDQDLGGLSEALRLLQVEEDAAALLEKNARALERLNLLQTVRLRNGWAPVTADSEEYKLAHEIMNSLTVLASIRPRANTSDADATKPASLIPPASVLRALHRTLPSAASQGWQGTLDESRKMALRDDTTVHVKAGAAAHVPAPAVAPTPVQTPYAAPPAYPTNSQYRQPNAYSYHNPVAARPAAQTSVNAQTAYYPNAYLQSQPATAAAAAQYQYSYAQWFNYQPQAGQKMATATPYYGTYMPQPGTSTPRAVGNTAKPQAQQNGWGAYGQGQATATLPAHLRRSGTSTPGISTSVQQNYAPYHPYVPAQPGK